MMNEIFFEIHRGNLNLTQNFRYRLKMLLPETNQNQGSILEQNLLEI